MQTFNLERLSLFLSPVGPWLSRPGTGTFLTGEISPGEKFWRVRGNFILVEHFRGDSGPDKLTSDC